MCLVWWQGKIEKAQISPCPWSVATLGSFKSGKGAWAFTPPNPEIWNGDHWCVALTLGAPTSLRGFGVSSAEINSSQKISEKNAFQTMKRICHLLRCVTFRKAGLLNGFAKVTAFPIELVMKYRQVKIRCICWKLHQTQRKHPPPFLWHGPPGCVVASHILQILMTLLVKFNGTLIPDEKDSFLKVSLKLFPCIFPLRPWKEK